MGFEVVGVEFSDGGQAGETVRHPRLYPLNPDTAAHNMNTPEG
jgi:hypothetical protein